MMESHPAADIFPMMNDDELAELTEDIRKNGLIEPITILDGKVLDGRNRAKACDMAGVPPKLNIAVNMDYPVSFVLSKNLHRRQLTVGQRSAIALEVREPLKVEAELRQRMGVSQNDDTLDPIESKGNSRGSRSDYIAGKALGVGASSVNRAAKVRKENPALYKQMKDGEVSSWNAYEQVVGKRPAQPNIGRAARLEKVKELAAQGFLAAQIASTLGIHRSTVVQMAKDIDVPLADHRIGRGGKGKEIDVNRVIEKSVVSAEGAAVGLEDLITDDTIQSVDMQQVGGWVQSLKESVKTLNVLVRRLRKLETQQGD